MKPLLPTLKEKKRYMVYEVLSKETIDQRSIEESIVKSLHNYVGLLGTAAAGIQFVRGKTPRQNCGVIRVAHHALPHLKGAIALIDAMSKEKVIVKSVAVSGTLKKARGYADTTRAQTQKALLPQKIGVKQ